MSKNKRMTEKMKNVVIVLLTLCAVVLGWETQLFGNSSVRLNAATNIFGLLEAGDNQQEEQNAAEKTIEASRPAAIVVTDESGKHYAVKYELSEINELYNKTVQLFSEALGLALTVSEVEEAYWQNALRSRGVYFEYMSPVKLSVLDGWYATELPGNYGETFVSRLAVVYGEEKSRVLFQDSITGQFYAADIEAPNNQGNLPETNGLSNAVFTFELDGAAEDRYALLVTDSAAHPFALTQNPLADEEDLSAALLELGVSEHLVSSFTDEDGTHFIAKDFTLRVSSDGTVVYRLTDKSAGVYVNQDESAAIELARHAVIDSIGQYCGDEADVAIYFDAINVQGTGYRVLFRYVVAGGQVHVGKDGYAAAVVIQNGIISDMVLHFRTYTISDEVQELLPEIQAQAASGGQFVLCYSDNGEEKLEPFWLSASSTGENP